MTNLLRGVVQRGTGKAASLNWPIGGKTGTTDDYTDAWFIGFDPDITIGVWIGLDQKKTIGQHDRLEAALPIWIEVMKAWIGDRKDPPKFEARGNIVFVSVDNSGASTDARRRGDFRGLHRGDPAGGHPLKPPTPGVGRTQSEALPSI